MDKLLNWSLAHQSGDPEAIAKVGEPDPKLLNQLFGGPDEPSLMKQSMRTVTDPNASEEEKEVALENFEILIENLDHANAIGNMGFWPIINSQLLPGVPDARRLLAASIIGIATQNNEKTQQDYHESNGLPALVAMGEDVANPQCQLKALFAITSYIRLFEPGYQQFSSERGWSLINTTNISDKKVLLRTLSLISAVLSTGLDDNKQQCLHQADVVGFLARVLDLDNLGGAAVGCIEKALQIVGQLDDEGYKFTGPEIDSLMVGIAKADKRGDISEDDVGIAKGAMKK